MYGGRSGPPFGQWQEPLGGKRCPRCHARMKSSAVDNVCVYCRYTEPKSTPAQDRSTSILPSVKHQIEEDVAEARYGSELEMLSEPAAPGWEAGPQESGPRRQRFVPFELPRSNNAERALVCGLLAVQAMMLLGGKRRHTPDIFDFATAEEALFIVWVVLAPVPLLLLAAYTTFPGLRSAVYVLLAHAVLVLTAALFWTLPYGILAPLSVYLPYGIGKTLAYAQPLLYAWAAWFLKRDTQALLED